jgi:threonylcarbamoyladenosine tRNA methylthiotransferase MtaB
MRVAFYTLGCKLNQAETESLADQFSQAGFQIADSSYEADICVANTCTVTHIADRKSRHWLRLARRRNPGALIVATGCYVERSREELLDLADLVVDNRDKENLLEIVMSLSSPAPSLVSGTVPSGHCESRFDRDEAVSPITTAARTRSLIKIQDGCQAACAYCIVPRVRPREYSLPSSWIIDKVKQKVALGYREVVLTGTRVGSYRDDGANIKDLIQLILDRTGIRRLRLSSLQPSEVSHELLALWQDKRLCPHFHLALQSGSDSVLQRMKRSYSLDQYQRTIDLIKDTIPEAAITTDVLVGFPGETDEEFEQSYSFCRQAGFANIHVFPFSLRPDTVGAGMPDQVKHEVKQGRTQQMLELSRSSRDRFREHFLGQTMPVLWEQETKPGSGIHSGLTGNYMRVFARSKRYLNNQITPVKLVGLRNHAMWGELTGRLEIINLDA